MERKYMVLTVVASMFLGVCDDSDFLRSPPLRVVVRPIEKSQDPVNIEPTIATDNEIHGASSMNTQHQP